MEDMDLGDEGAPLYMPYYPTYGKKGSMSRWLARADDVLRGLG